jgi:hypothetical protein
MMDFIWTQVKKFVSVGLEHWHNATKEDKILVAGSSFAILLSLVVKPLLLAAMLLAGGAWGLYVVWDGTK